MKISQNPTSNFHAARINRIFFGSSGSNSFTGVKYFIHSLWENCANMTSERFRALFRTSKIFVIKNFWIRVGTYLWERDIEFCRVSARLRLAPRDRWLHISEIFDNKIFRNPEKCSKSLGNAVRAIFPWSRHPGAISVEGIRFVASKKDWINSCRVKIWSGFWRYFRAFQL